MKRLDKDDKMPADNWRFGAIAAVNYFHKSSFITSISVAC